jgi:hypothetical protein
MHYTPADNKYLDYLKDSMIYENFGRKPASDEERERLWIAIVGVRPNPLPNGE